MKTKLISDVTLIGLKLTDIAAVDPEWLISTGAFHRPMQSAASNVISSISRVRSYDGDDVPLIQIEFPRSRNIKEIPAWRYWIISRLFEMNSPPTRGQIRMAAAVFGIELKETA